MGSRPGGGGVEQKKETLERFAYCNSAQLFQNNLIDLRQFIRANYEKFCALVERQQTLRQEVEQR